MKKFVFPRFKFASILLVLLLALSSSIYAEDLPVGSVNHFKPMIDDQYYGALLKHVFDGGDLNEAVNLYGQFVGSLPSSGYELWMQELSMARACLILARYSIDTGKEYKAWAETFMNEADKLIRSAEEHEAPKSAIMVLDALSNSFWYLVNGSLSKAMKFPDMADEAYESNPEDFHALLLDADRYLYSPGIVGGNKKKGLSLFQEAEKAANLYGAAEWDLFSIYSGLASGYDKNGDHGKAVEYATLAKEIYSADKTVNSILSK